MDQPSYTLQELKDWVFVHGYQALFDAWAGSGFKRMCAPSVDRLDSSKSYTFDNIRLVPWQENIDKIGLDNFRNPRSTNKSGVSGVHANRGSWVDRKVEKTEFAPLLSILLGVLPDFC